MFVPAQPAWAILVSTSTFLCNNFNNHFYTDTEIEMPGKDL